MESQDDRKGITCYCVCGGWVFVSALGYDKQSDAETYREVSKMIKLGFAVEHHTVAEFRKDPRPCCPEMGKCTTAPHKIKKADLPLFAEAEASPSHPGRGEE